MESFSKHPKKLAKSFKYAFEGFYAGIKTETNWKIGILQAIVVILAGVYFQISNLEWILVTILIGLILSAELGNSAVEAIVDSFMPDEHPKAKLAKDFAAGSVVIIIVASAIVGLIIFLPYL